MKTVESNWRSVQNTDLYRILLYSFTEFSKTNVNENIIYIKQDKARYTKKTAVSRSRKEGELKRVGQQHAKILKWTRKEIKRRQNGMFIRLF